MKFSLSSAGIKTAGQVNHDDNEVLGRYGGFNGALQRLAALQRIPQARVTEGVSIDEYSTFRATRFLAKNGGA